MSQAEIKVRADGPYRVSGDFVIRDASGTVVEVERTNDSIVLCRCGASGDKPFCDGSHVRAGFTDGGAIAPRG